MKCPICLICILLFQLESSGQIGNAQATSKDTLAAFPGGDTALESFIKDHLRITKDAVQAKVNDHVTVKFTVDENGYAGDFLVTKRIGYGCDELALKVLRSMPRWQPGVINGRRIKTSFNQNIHFHVSLPVIAEEAKISREMLPNLPLKFGDSTSDLKNFISTHFMFPKSARKSLNDVVVVKFMITRDGVSDNVQIISGLSPEIDAEIVRCIKSIPKWHPKQVNFRPVDEYMELVIRIKNGKASLE